MYRSIEEELKKWRDSSSRYPLLLRGARQVGKTYIVEKWGKTFESYGKHVIPIEVKAEALGHLKSLMQFIKEKNAPLGIRISQHPLSFKDQVLSVPFYMIDQIPRLIKHCLGS